MAAMSVRIKFVFFLNIFRFFLLLSSKVRKIF
nr:MAG TPA: hypothetical protein [Caudoviricetes sp.]